MRSSKARTELGLAMSLGLLVLCAGCPKSKLTGLSGNLAFSCPEQPADLVETDAGVYQIAFDEVLVGSSKTLTLVYASVGNPVTLGALTALQPDPEFSLPFVAGTVVPLVPSQITVSFTPTSVGDKSAVMQLAADGRAAETVLFELSGVGIVNGLSVVPNPVDFGEVEINHSQSVALTITNSSLFAESLAFSPLQGQTPDRFSLAPPSTPLAPSGSTTLNVAFQPLVDGPASAAFTINSTPPNLPVTVNLQGIGVDSWIQVTSPLEFGFVQIGDSVVKTAVVKNVGSYTTLHVWASPPGLLQPSGQAAYSLAAPVPTAPTPLAPGQSLLFPVTFAPLSLEEISGALLFETDDPLSAYPTVALDGYGGGPHISCLPILSFGPVPVGATAFEDSFCLNAGTDIPSLPQLGLTIAQSTLSTDSPAFVPSLVLPDGGLAGSGYGVSLSAGQQAAIRVAFQPQDAGAFEGRLTVPSNDIGDLDAGTILLAQGGVSGSCTLEVTPAQLSFGEVPAGGRGVLQYELSNTGQAFCQIDRVSLDADSDPAFSLSDGGLGVQLLSFPGNSDNPGALPSSVVLQAEFTPTTSKGAAAGTIDVTSLNAVPPDQTISLTGLSEPACLSIEPPNLDFGVVGFSVANQQACGLDSASFIALNECPSSVTLSQIALNSVPGSLPQFALQSNLQLPITLAPGGQASFQADFVPTSVGPKLGGLVVASSEFPSDPFLITLQGDAEPTGTHTDTFVVPSPAKKVDLLWVLDEDDDAAQIAMVANVLPQLIDTMNQDQLDYRIAVTSTDTCDAGLSDQGSFEPCDHCLSAASSTPTFITPTTPNASTALMDLFGLFDVAPQLGFCETVNGDEHFFDSIADAFSPALLSGHNSGFVRDGAYLAVILVNGDAEDDAYGAGMGGPYLTSLAQVTTLVQGLKPDPSMVSVSYINSGAGTVTSSQRIGQLVQATGGIEADTSEAAAIWQASLLNLFAFTEGTGEFHLLSTPASASQIQVDVNGIPEGALMLDPFRPGAWIYDPDTNDIVFVAGQLPPAGATVTVTYEVGCP